MDCLHLVYPQPINSVQADRQKVTKGPVHGGKHSANSLTNRSFLGSTVQRQAQNKALANETKWSELPQNFCQKSLPGSESSHLLLNSSNAIDASTAFSNDAKVDNVVRKRKKKKSKRTKRKGKKQQSQTGSTELEVLSEERHHVGAVTGTSHSVDEDRKDSAVLSSTKVEPLLPEKGVHNSETPKTCISHIKDLNMLEESLTERHSVSTFENQPPSKDSADSICDGSRNTNHTQVSCYNYLSEEHQHIGAVTGTSHSVDEDGKDSAVTGTKVEPLLPEKGVHNSETPKTCISHIKDLNMLEESLTEKHSVSTCENQPASKDSEDSICDGSRNTKHTQVSCYNFLSEERQHVGAVTGTSHSVDEDVKDSAELSSTKVEPLLPENWVHNSETPKRCISHVKDLNMLEASLTEKHSVSTFENQPPSKDSADSIWNGSRNTNHTQVSCYNYLSEERQHVGAVTGASHSVDEDGKDSAVLSSTKVEPLLPEKGVHNSETPKTSTSHVKGLNMLEESLTEKHCVGTFENQPASKDSADSICDGSRYTNRTQVSCYNYLRSRDCSNMPNSIPVLTHSNRLRNTEFYNVSKHSEKESWRTDLSGTPASNFGKGSVSCKSLSNDIVNKTSRGGQYRSNGSDVLVAVPGKWNKQNKHFSQSSSVSRFRSTGNFQGHPTKAASHSVWQKVPKKGTCDSIGDLMKVPHFSWCDGTLEEASLLKRSFNTSENGKQLKDNVSWKFNKSDAALKECKLDSGKGPHADLVKSHGCARITTCPNETVTLESVCHTNYGMKSHIDDLNHLLPKSCNSSDLSKAVQVPSPVFLPHPLGNSVRQRQENIPLAEGMQNCSSGYVMQKWVPIGLKDLGLRNSADGSSLEYSHNPAAESLTAVKTVKSKLNANSPDFVPQGVMHIGKSSGNASHSSCDDESGTMESKHRGASMLEEQKNKRTADHVLNMESGVLNASGSVPDRIAEAVIAACRVQLASENVERASGHPIAEFERLLHNSCPVVYRLPHLVCHTSSRDQFGSMLLCRHETPDISLGSIWKWYEEHSNYGLEIRAHDHENTKRSGADCLSFYAYFVPYLSAVQLFRNHKKLFEATNNKISSSEVSSCGRTNISERSSCVEHLPIFSALCPQPHVNQVCTSTKRDPSLGSVETTLSTDAELLFEYFECEQPQQRLPLYEKIKELVRGDRPSRYQGYGDPTTLDFTRLHDLHPKSWYSVAWYPIYRIPESNFRASFLTFHSLGHLMRRSARIDSQSVQNCIVCPVVGLETYNAQNECWFQLRRSPLNQAKGALDLNASRILEERLRTLEETASLMARAVVNKGSLASVNRHPDYEFFRSRKRW